MGPFSTVLFDLDDTLLDSFEAREIALEGVFKHAGIGHLDAGRFLHDLRGKPFKDAVSELQKEHNIIFDLFTDYRRHYWTKDKGILKLYPGVREMLEELHSQGVRLGIVTQKTRSMEFEGYPAGAIMELEEIGISNLFRVIVGFEDVAEHKPHPEGINIALSSLKSEPEETIMVGDSFADIEAARAAGCSSCYSIWGIPESEHEPEGIRADFVAATPQMILNLNYL